MSPGGPTSKWSELGRVIRRWWSGPDLRRVAEIPELAEARRWAVRYIPLRDDPIYGVVQGLAERSYQELVALADNLDRKADDLMKTSAALAAALAAAGRIAGASALLEHPRLILASVGCLVATLLLCARIRTPSNKAAALSIRSVLAIADVGVDPSIAGIKGLELAHPDRPTGEHELPGDDESVGSLTENQLKAVIAASYELALAGLELLIDWKEDQLRWATRLFTLALLLLILALARAI